MHRIIKTIIFLGALGVYILPSASLWADVKVKVGFVVNLSVSDEECAAVFKKSDLEEFAKMATLGPILDSWITAANEVMVNSSISGHESLGTVTFERQADVLTLEWDYTKNLLDEMSLARLGTDAGYDRIAAWRKENVIDIVGIMGCLPKAIIGRGADVRPMRVGPIAIATAYQNGSNMDAFTFYNFYNIEAGAGSANNFVHEIGHVLGANHTRRQVAADAAAGEWTAGQNYRTGMFDPDANYGFAFVVEGDGDGGKVPDQYFKTLMGYPGDKGTRIRYFSNPEVLYRGVATGDEYNNNAAAIISVIKTVANFGESLQDP